MKRVGISHLVIGLLGMLLSTLALASASASQTFQITVDGLESVSIDLGQTSPQVDYYNSNGLCSVTDRFCAWYPTILYSTNYASDRKLVAKATITNPNSSYTTLTVVLEKQSAPYDSPLMLGSGNNPGVWAFSGNTLILTNQDQAIVVNIKNGTNYAIAPKLKFEFSAPPPEGTYSATVTFTIMAQ